MVYEKEITECFRHDLYYVDAPGAQPLPIDSLMRRVQASLPDTVTATGITTSPDPERTWQVSLSAPRRASVFVDPYTAEVKGRNERLPFFDTMFHLHRWLLGPSQNENDRMPAGKWIVGTSTLMLVLILLTGIGMWLTNRHKPLRKSLRIAVTKGWPRFWHDLHVAGGIYVTIFLLAIALTGLTWSFSWYRTGFYALCGAEASADGGHGGSHGAGRHGNRAGSDAHKGQPEEGHEQRNHHHGDADVQEEQPEERHERRNHSHGDADVQEGQPEERHEQRNHHHGDADAQEGQPEEDHEQRNHHHGDADAQEGQPEEGHEQRNHHHGDADVQEGQPEEDHERRNHHHGDADAQEGQPEERHEQRNHSHGHADAQEGHRNGHGQEAHQHEAEQPQAQATTEQCDSTCEAAPYAHWQTIYEQLVRTNPGYRQITLSDGTAGVVPEGRRSLRAADTYDFDPLTGQITATHPYADTDKATRVRSAIYMVHTGSWLGWLSRLVNFLAALIGTALPLTGYYLWIRRRRNRQKHGKNEQSEEKTAK